MSSANFANRQQPPPCFLVGTEAPFPVSTILQVIRTIVPEVRHFLAGFAPDWLGYRDDERKPNTLILSGAVLAFQVSLLLSLPNVNNHIIDMWRLVST
jgi:hypothetical protein